MKGNLVIISILLAVILLIVIFSVSIYKNEGESTYKHLIKHEGIIYVDDNSKSPYLGTKTHPFNSINDAILNADEFSTIYIFKGTYFESFLLDKTLEIIGEDKNNTIIDGSYKDYVIKTTSDENIICNLTIRNSGGFQFNSAIKLNSDNNKIMNCIFYRTRTAIYSYKTQGNSIQNSIFHTNGEGVNLYDSKNCEVKNSYFTHNAQGLNIQKSNDIDINNCYANLNGLVFFISDSSDIDIHKCAVYDNNDNQGGLLLNFCNDINIQNSIINHNGFGLNIADSSNINVLNCDFLYSGHNAIRIKSNSEDITVENCEISENFRYAVSVFDSKCKIINNNFYKNLFGIHIEKSNCDARKNWWGSFLGPAIFEKNQRDRFGVKLGIIRLIPWSIQKNKNSGADWEIEKNSYDINIESSRFEQIKLEGTDSDNDGLPDWWEDKWGYDKYKWDDHANLDPDEDSLNNFEECFTDEWDSNPYIKDVFLEIDWIKSAVPGNGANQPPKEYIKDMIQVFEEHDINLHVDDGKLGGGEEIQYVSSFSLADMRDYYWDYFLHNDLNNPRKGIFHYCLISDYGPEPGGPGFAFVGWDNVDSFSISAQRISENHPLISRDRIAIGVIIHELGHTMGLFPDDHGGNDNTLATEPLRLQWWKYQNYKSCMNYRYTYRILDYSDGSHGKNDFDDWSNLDFYFFKDSNFDWPK